MHKINELISKVLLIETYASFIILVYHIATIFFMNHDQFLGEYW